MKYKPRDYQIAAAEAALRAFKSQRNANGIIVIPTGGGKSLCIAEIAYRLDEPLLVLQPSVEILKQNFEKLKSYGFDECSMYSASVNRKEISKVTFATIGSIIHKKDKFKVFRYVLIDECHYCNSKGGMYEEFIHDREDRRVVGFTATPYRLGQYYEGGSILKFLTRTRPRIFTDVLYYVQIKDLLSRGYLAQLRYFDVTNLDLTRVKSNSTGADYDEKSLKLEYERSGFNDQLSSLVLRVLHPKSGKPRNGILVFTRFVEESEMLVNRLKLKGYNSAIVTGTTPKKEREDILERFKSGEIKVVANADCLATGFDYPALDTVIMARPTKSLAKYYQIVGRCIRPYEGKDGWFIDMCGNYRQFGKVDDLVIGCPPKSTRWAIYSNGRQLTNIPFS